jgi:hypothetical protein
VRVLKGGLMNKILIMLLLYIFILFPCFSDSNGTHIKVEFMVNDFLSDLEKQVNKKIINSKYDILDIKFSTITQGEYIKYFVMIIYLIPNNDYEE